MPIKKIKEYVHWLILGNESLEQRQKLFKDHTNDVEQKIKELTKKLDFLEYKCWFYDKAVELGHDDIFNGLTENDIPENIKEIAMEMHKNLKSFLKENKNPR